MAKHICPWCDEEIHDIWEYDLHQDDSSVEVECPSCDKKIEITLNISYDYKIAAIGCELHQFEVGDYWHPGASYLQVKCKLCKASFYDHSLAGGKFPSLKREQYEFVGKAKAEAEKRGLS